MVTSQRLGNRATLLTICAAVVLAVFLAIRVPPSQVVLIGVLLAFVPIAAYMSMTNPKMIYYLLIAVLPLEATLVWEIGFSLTLAYPVIALLLLGIASRRERLDFSSTEVRLFLFYLAICAVSVVNAYLITPPRTDFSGAMAWRASALRPIIQFALIVISVLFFVIMVQKNTTEQEILRSLKVYLAVAAVLAFLGVYQSMAVTLDLPGKDFTFAFGAAAEQSYRYGEVRPYSGLITGFAPRTTFRESLNYSHYLISFLPLAIALALYRGQLPARWRTRLPGALALLGITALFLTLSRSGWLAFASSFLFLICFLPKKKLALIALGATGVLIAVVALLQHKGYFDASSDLWNLIQTRMATERLEADPRVSYATTLFNTFRQYPLLGVGIGNYGVFGASAYGLTKVLSAHSIFLNALVENGIFGFLALAAIMIHFFAQLLRAIRRCRGLVLFPYLVGVGAGVLGMSIQYLSFGDRPSFYYLMMLAVGYALIRLSRLSPTPVEIC